MRVKTKQDYRTRRHARLRRKVQGSTERPRMAVFLSNKHMYVQFIDDTAGATLAEASTFSPGLKGKSATVDTAAELGKMAAERAKEKGITNVVFDRGGYRYGGRVRALADAAREAGIKI